MQTLSSGGERLIEAAVRQHLLSPLAASRVRHLCQHDLSLEQALIGTGLLTSDVYGELLSQVTGHPFVRANDFDQEMIDEDERIPVAMRRRHHIHPLFQDNQEMAVGFVHPDEPSHAQAVQKQLRVHGLRLRPYVILYSDWRQRYPERSTEDRLGPWVRDIFRGAHEQGATHVTFSPGEDTLHVWFDGLRYTPSFDTVRAPMRALRSALEMRIQRQTPRVWHLASSGASSEKLTLVRHPDETHHHPIHLMQVLPRHASGLVIVVDGDPYTQAWLEQQAPANLLRDRWSVSASTLDEVEEAVHAALAGSTGVLRLSRTLFDEAKPLWQALQHARIPMRLIRAHRVGADQYAWESAPYSV